MQLVNMDVERHGTPALTRLGPFSPGLNAICGPKGSGKTTLLNWLRHSASEGLAGNATSFRSPVVGSIELANGPHRWQLHNTRQAVTSQPYTNSVGNLSATQREAFAALAAASGAADTEAALEAVAQRLGLDTLVAPHDPSRQQLLTRQRDVESRLLRLQHLGATRESLLTRRSELESELQAAQGAQFASVRGERGVRYAGHPSEHRRYDDRWTVIEADLRDTLARLEELDRQLAELRGELTVLETTKASVTVDNSFRLQLQEIDDRLTRWRQTLRDLKAHRNRVEHDATDARLDKQVGEQLSITKEPDPRAPLRSLEAQILSARKQLDALVDRYSLFGEPRSDNYAVRQDAQGRTRIDYHDAYYRNGDSSNLPETLRSMQKDLYEACQQLARHESRAASQTLKQQSEQLQRCEAELLHSVEKLIEERAMLLRKIADEYQLSHEQLSLAFGNWCDCHDHSHLQDWLLNESQVETSRVGHDPLARQRLLERIEALEADRKGAEVRAEHCKRQLRDAEFQHRSLAERVVEPRGRLVVDIQRDVDGVQDTLRQWDERERLLAEADELRRRLATTGPQAASHNPFREAVHRHIAGLMGGRGRPATHSRYSSVTDSPRARYDLVDGIVYDSVQRSEVEVPAALVRVAQRLAIAEAVAARSEPIMLLLDEALDHLLPELQTAAIAHLAQVAAAGQQIILLTGDQRVADVVHSHQGWVAYLHRQAAPVIDINRHLTALANDYEMDKWYQPAPQQQPLQPTSPPMRREYYLTERSRVEESPSIDALAASRCRAVGVDRVGDLLDVDPHWLAEQLRLDGVTEATVASWQAEARLLCSVRQLRPFDARLLVSIGVRTPQQLAEMHPSQLLDRVERFVATPRGRRLLRSGSSYELSRITTWIASAKGGAGRYGRSNFSDDQYAANDRHTDHAQDLGDNQGYAHDYDFAPQDREESRWGNQRSSDRSHRSPRGGRTNGAEQADRSRGERASRDFPVLNGANGTRRRVRSDAEGEPRQRRVRTPGQRGESLKLAQAEFARGDTSSHKFYLELSSPVVDAPSIGPRMATRLEKFGIFTVDQLLACHAESLADKLHLRRVDAEAVRGWQEQARLVCRIPNLRGHDAQLLVACNLTSPEELAEMNAASVLEQVLMVAASNEGQRILRGGKQPDLAEVKDWIQWASQCRSLNAA